MAACFFASSSSSASRAASSSVFLAWILRHYDVILEMNKNQIEVTYGEFSSCILCLSSNSLDFCLFVFNGFDLETILLRVSPSIHIRVNHKPDSLASSVPHTFLPTPFWTYSTLLGRPFSRLQLLEVAPKVTKIHVNLCNTWRNM